MKTYTGIITELKPNQIFVFGSNTQGRHGMGSALQAVRRFGAIYGNPKGIQGQSYAIITKDLTKTKHPSIKEIEIIDQILELYVYAKDNPQLEFLIAYSNKPNLNGYKPEEMAQMFNCGTYPDNIIFEESFYNLIKSL